MAPFVLSSKKQTLSQTKLYIHPKWICQEVSNAKATVMLSEATSYTFRWKQFPWLSKINGGISRAELLAATSGQTFMQQALQHQQIRQFVKEGLLWEGSEGDYQRLAARYRHDWAMGEKVEGGGLRLLNLSGIPSGRVASFAEKLSARTNLSPLKEALWVFIDDFLDPRLADLQSTTASWILCKVSGPYLALGPFSAENHPISLAALQQRILHNQPVRKSLQRLMGQTLYLPRICDPDPLPDFLKRVVESKEEHHNWSETVLEFRVAQHSIHFHPLILGPIAEQVAKNANEGTIDLCSQPIMNAVDGGARTISPRETVERLLPFVSELTGVVTHLSEHPNSPKPISVFTSGFHYAPDFAQKLRPTEIAFKKACMGKGVGAWQSKASAICEAFERHNAVYNSEAPSMVGKADDLPHRSYLYHDFASFSEVQYAEFAADIAANGLGRHAVQAYDNASIPWTKTGSLTYQEPVYVPTTLCYSNMGDPASRYGRWQSNGASAGNTKEEAILQGLLELIERDATALWWYHRQVAPHFPLSQLPSKALEKLVASLGAEHSYWVLDITHDIGVPVMVAVAKHQQTGKLTLGFGGHLIPELAAQRALTELCQLIAIRDQHASSFDMDALVAEPYILGHESEARPGYLMATHGDLKLDIEALVKRLQELSMEVLVLDYTRAPFPIHTVKVWVPGLCHIWPQLGTNRLYEAPVQMGWCEVPPTTEMLNPMPLYL